MRSGIRQLALAAPLAALGLLAISSTTGAQTATPPPEPATLNVVVESDPPGFEGVSMVHVPGGLDAVDATPGQVALALYPWLGAVDSGSSGAPTGFPSGLPNLSGLTGNAELAEVMSESFTSPATRSGLDPGLHSLVLVPVNDAIRPIGVECFEQGPTGLTRLDVSSTPSPRLVTLDLRPGDVIDCTFSIDARRLPGSLSVSASGDAPAGDGDPIFLVYQGSLADVPYEVVDALVGRDTPGVGGGNPFDFSLSDALAQDDDATAGSGDAIAFALPVGASFDLGTLPIGPRTIMLTDLPAGLEVEAITCAGEPDTPVAITGNGPYDEPRVALVGITTANAVSCDFRLAAGGGPVDLGASEGPGAPDEATAPEKTAVPEKDPRGKVPRAGRWDVVNLPASITCGGQRFDLPRTTDKGTIEVRRDGDRIIAQGIGEGRGRTVLDRASVEPSVFRGKIRIRQRGVEFTLNVTLEVPQRTRIRGDLGGDFKAAGINCKLSREFSAKFAGK